MSVLELAQFPVTARGRSESAKRTPERVCQFIWGYQGLVFDI